MTVCKGDAVFRLEWFTLVIPGIIKALGCIRVFLVLSELTLLRVRSVCVYAAAGQ